MYPDVRRLDHRHIVCAVADRKSPHPVEARLDEVHHFPVENKTKERRYHQCAKNRPVTDNNLYVPLLVRGDTATHHGLAALRHVQQQVPQAVQLGVGHRDDQRGPVDDQRAGLQGVRVIAFRLQLRVVALDIEQTTDRR
jgi:hypothetical protein